VIVCLIPVPILASRGKWLCMHAMLTYVMLQESKAAKLVRNMPSAQLQYMIGK